MEKLVANLSTKVQRKTLGGRNYLVAPVVMILEGVFAGNQGALFYDGEEISKSVNGWNHRPITVGHPQASDGVKISGCTPEAIDTVGIGMVLNTSWNSKTKKLRAQAWFEESRLDTVPGAHRIKEALTKEAPLEVSTGLFVDNELSQGIHNGREYQGKARNFKPDHLAIILNGVGACSVKDGAGLLVNRSNESFEGVATYTLNGISYTENFTARDGLVTLIGNRTEISKTDTSEPIITNTKVSMSKEQLLKALGDDHKDFVESLSDSQAEALTKLERVVEKVVEVPVANKAESLEDVLAVAPAAIKAQIEEALVVNADHRNALTAKIAANPQNSFSNEELAAMPTVTLQKMAALVVNAAPENKPQTPAKFAGSAGMAGDSVVVKGFLPPSSFDVKG
jgi:hypothetical protein